MRAVLLVGLGLVAGGLVVGWLAGALPSDLPDAVGEADERIHEPSSEARSLRRAEGPAQGTLPPAGSSATEPGLAAEDARRLEAAIGSLRMAFAKPMDDAGAKDERRALLRVLRGHAKHLNGSYALLGRLDVETDDATALRLGRALRHSPYPEIARALQERLERAPAARVRRAAVAGLEHRDAALWKQPLTRAFKTDADGAVRSEAALALGRSLLDPRYRSVHGEVREVLYTGLGDPAPEHRLRTLTALMSDRHAGPAQLDAVRPLLEDPDQRVRHEAAATLRVLESMQGRTRR